jgi:hypothetical protein
MSIPHYEPTRFAASVPPLTTADFAGRAVSDIDAKISCFADLLKQFNEVEDNSRWLQVDRHRYIHHQLNKMMVDLFQELRQRLVESDKPLEEDEDIEVVIDEIEDQITQEKNSLEDLLMREQFGEH